MTEKKPEPNALEQIISNRESKADLLRANGINPYPYNFEVSHTTSQIHDTYSTLNNGQTSDEEVSVTGRVIRQAKLGKMLFLDIEDSVSKVQILLERDKLGQDSYNLIKKTLDRGDIIGINGNPIRTNKGELSINATTYQMLSKTTRPLPSKEVITSEGIIKGGLADESVLYQQPELRMITDANFRSNITKRSKFISIMRRELENNQYLEVEIPTLQPVYGGAGATPFTTNVKALDDQQVFLSISPEIYLKRYMVGGLGGVYSIVHNFRNEGMDKSHHPEFTSMECYMPNKDYIWLMEMTEKLIETIFLEINGTTKVAYNNPNSDLGEHVLDFKTPWKRSRMPDLVKDIVGIDVENMSEDNLRLKVQETYKNTHEPYIKLNDKVQDYKELSWGEMVGILFEAYVEDSLIQPTFVTDHPRESSPLCKGVRNGDKRLIERFEAFGYGMELTNAYSELNDPKEQRRLLELQEINRDSGKDSEAYPFDEAFCQAIEYGMPPAAGLGIGIDRMVMFLTGATTIRDVIAFPLGKAMEAQYRFDKKTK